MSKFKGSENFHGQSRDLITAATGDGNDYTADEDDQIIYANTNDSTLTVTLPSEAERDGKTVTIQDAGGNAGTNAITVTAASGADVDGSDQDLTVSSNYESLTLSYSSDESGWFSQ